MNGHLSQKNGMMGRFTNLSSGVGEQVAARSTTPILKAAGGGISFGMDSARTWAIGKSAIEIGPGPTPMLVCAPESITRRIAIEPLAEKFRETGWQLPESVQWIAEPLETASISERVDLVICVNVLDHMDDPRLSLSKMHDALNDPGYLFLWVHTQQVWYSRIYDRLPFKNHDHMHPHRFTRRSLVSSLGDAGFSDIRSINWKTSRDPSKTKTLKERIIQKIAVSETLVVAKT